MRVWAIEVHLIDWTLWRLIVRRTDYRSPSRIVKSPHLDTAHFSCPLRMRCSALYPLPASWVVRFFPNDNESGFMCGRDRCSLCGGLVSASPPPHRPTGGPGSVPVSSHLMPLSCSTQQLTLNITYSLEPSHLSLTWWKSNHSFHDRLVDYYGWGFGGFWLISAESCCWNYYWWHWLLFTLCIYWIIKHHSNTELIT